VNNCLDPSRWLLSFPAVALRTHAPGGRPAYDPYQRRLDLYVKAAPVFRMFGYRQVTMKALAHACGVSAPALYRYFPSKLDFALFPLEEPPTGSCTTLLMAAADAHADPLRGLRAALEAAVEHADLMALAVQLAIDAGRDERDVFSPRRLDSLDSTMRDVLLHCVPALGPRAQDLAHTLISLVVTAGAAKTPLSQEDLWRQGASIVRPYLLDAGVEAARLSEVFAG
jgi:AcrR family transcriptional regulator